MSDKNATKSQQVYANLSWDTPTGDNSKLYPGGDITSKNINLNPDNVHKYGGDR